MEDEMKDAIEICGVMIPTENGNFVMPEYTHITGAYGFGPGTEIEWVGENELDTGTMKKCPCGKEDCRVNWTEFEKLSIESRWGRPISFLDKVQYWAISDWWDWLMGR